MFYLFITFLQTALLKVRTLTLIAVVPTVFTFLSRDMICVSREPDILKK